MALTNQLSTWRDWLARVGAPVAPHLLPGLGQVEIEEALGGNVPQDVIDWFGWCDGIAHAPGQTIGDSWTIPGYWPIALRDAIDVKPSYDPQHFPLLGEHWMPILETGTADLYAAVWSHTTEPAVVSVMPEVGEAVEFDSIEQMVTVFNECFARSAYFLDGEGLLAVDDALYAEVYTSIVGRAPFEE